MRRRRYCVVATPGGGVDVHARLVQPSPPHPESLAVRIGTSRTSRKVRELERTGRATLIYEDAPRDACVVLVGAARVLTAEEARLVPFPPLFHAFFPQGPAQDDFVFVEVVPDRLEVIDFARKVTPEPFGLAPAVLVRQGGRWVSGAA
jgi:general stress protein 26